MIKAGNITKGMFLDRGGEPVLVTDKEFFNPGKGGAVVRVKLKSLKTGNVVKEVLKTDIGVEEIDVDHRRLQFSYKNGNEYVFIDPRTFEQVEIEGGFLEGSEDFIKEGEQYGLVFWQDRAVSITLPKKIVFTVVKAEEAVKGDTATGATKAVVLENGATVKVPLFIKSGEKIIINTETGSYVGRKN